METLTQVYRNYTKEDHAVWALLFERQASHLVGKACTEYLQGLKVLRPVLNAERIPDFNRLNEALKAEIGWSIEVVAGLIPVDAFFLLLSQKKFPSSTWLRSRDHLDYLEEPDMFHDIFGHIPQLVHTDYSNFMQKFGEIGYLNRHDEALVIKLQRLYWYTIEFGLILEHGKRRIYGAGIASSVKETQHAFGPNITVLPYDIQQIMATDFIISNIQSAYFEINSYQQLYASLLSI